MSLTTSGGASILTPDQVDQLVVRPFSQESVALRTSTVVPINSHTLRIPIVTADPVAGFVAEGAEISATDPTLTEVNITPYKLAGLVVISAELAADSSPAALQVVGDGLSSRPRTQGRFGVLREHHIERTRRAAVHHIDRGRRLW